MADVATQVAAIWPAPHEVVIGRGGRGSDDVLAYAVLPTAKRPTRLLPLRPAAVTAAVLGDRRAGTSGLRSSAQRLGALAARAGAATLLPHQLHVRPAPGAPRLDHHLAELLDLSSGDAVVSIHLGPPRANRKPVLRILTPEGHTVGYAKVGTSDLARTLVRREASALTRVHGAGLRLVTPPRVRHADRWQAVELLVLDPLPHADRAARPEVVQAASVELSTAMGVHEEALAASEHWRRSLRGIDALPEPWRDELGRRALRLESLAGRQFLPFGCWHGDWTPWNVAERDHRLLAWDWERFASGVPLGFDAVHWGVQRAARRASGDRAAAARASLVDARVWLQPWGLGARSGLVTALYLLEIAARYAQDGQDAAGAPLGDLRGWLLPAMDDLASDVGGNLHGE